MKRLLALCTLVLLSTVVCQAKRKPLKNPDLAKGEKPDSVKSYGMGPTGFVGWVFNNGRDSAESRQILVTKVDPKSPADGKLEKDDVILGADGSGADGDPALFSSDSRKALAAAIEAAEARTPATLKLLRFRDGTTQTVTLALETMGKYADTAPYDCEKSKKVLAKGLEHLYAHGKPKLFNMNAFIFMAANDPANPNNDKYQTKAKEWVYNCIPSEEMMKAMLDDFSKVRSSKAAWTHAYQLILLTEYYLQTKDEKVLPAIEAYAVCFAKGQSWIGTTGHGYSLKRPDGGFNGPMAGYGAINGSGVAGFLGLVLARKSGLKNPEVLAAIDRADLFFSHFAFRGGIGYGEYGPSLGKTMYDMNGKHGTNALALALQPKRAKEARYFMKMTACSSYNRAYSHAGPFFNYVWPGLGAAAGGEKLAAHYFRRTRWDHELSRLWNGRFSHSPLNRGGAEKADSKREAEEVAALLMYTLPLRQLYITGRDPNKKLWFSKKEVEKTVAAENFDPNDLTDDELLAALDNWSPNVRAEAVDELAKRETFKALIPKLREMAKDTARSRISRAHACVLIAKAQDKPSADVLVELLQDKDSWVRYAAAFSLRTMPDAIKKIYVNDLLRAAISMGRPTFPLDPDDPLQQAQGEVSMLLFYDGNAYGPRGVISNGIDGVDRTLLLPAIRAVAQTASGLRRTILRSVYPRLSYEEVLELAPTIVESVRVQAPADAMFSAGIMKAGAQVLQKHGIAEGVPLLRVVDYRIKKSTIDILRSYAGGALTVEPDPEALDFLYEKLYVKGDLKAKDAITAVLADKNPKPLKTLKAIKSVVAEPAVLSLPSISATLRVDAVNYALLGEKDTTYTWRMVYGGGNVAFKPNATWDSKTTTIEFDDKKPGKYRFEVTMSDVLGYTIARKTVDVTLNDEDGDLPPNEPPQAHSRTVEAIPGLPAAITLTGDDSENAPLAFKVVKKPIHGKLSGVPPKVSYVADFGYAGTDTFEFEVIDGQGIAAKGTISLNVEAKPVAVSVYEGFDYPVGDISGKSGDSVVGLKGNWSGGGRSAYTVAKESFAHTHMPCVGGKLNSKGTRTGITRPISPDAMALDGLLEDGSELWFSAVMGRHDKINFRNSNLAFGLQGGKGDEAVDVGLSWSTMSMHAAINGKLGRSAIGWPGYKTVFPANTPLLFVGRCVWGDGADKPDTVEIYRVIEDHNGQLIRLQRPVSTFSASVDQSKLDTLYIRYSGGFLLDEIRIGPTYESAILGTVSTVPEKKEEE